MSLNRPIFIPSLGPPVSHGSAYFKRNSSDHSKHVSTSSDLLQSIRAALSGSGSEPKRSFHSTIFPAPDELDGGEEELSWNETTVVWSAGGVQKRKWNFEEEGQHIQWACVGSILQPGMVHSGHANSAARYTSDQSNESTSSPKGDEDTFGPFFRAKQARQKTVEDATLVRGVFVFLRSFGKVFLMTGLEYTFSLPFLVQNAWPLYPHGILIQRVLDRAEADEAEITGEFTLPTLFTITNPFQEPQAVGLAEGIVGGFAQIPPKLKNNDKNSTRPLKSVPADEQVIWVSPRWSRSSDEVIATVDAERRKLSIWRYAHIYPEDITVAIGRSRARSMNRKMTSTANAAAAEMRPSPVAQELANRADRMMPRSPDTLEPTQAVEFPEMPPLSSLPGMPPALSTTTTLASLASGSSMASQWAGSGARRGRRNSLTRNELSMTMDRMVLGRRAESDASMPPIDRGRMQPAVWMEKLFVQELDEKDAVTWDQISVSVFDQRWNGHLERSRIGVCLPGTARLFILDMTQQLDKTLKVVHAATARAVSAVALKVTRENQWDLLAVHPNGELKLLTHGRSGINIKLRSPEIDVKAQDNDNYEPMAVDGDGDLVMRSIAEPSKIVALSDPMFSSVTIVFENGTKTRTSTNLLPNDFLTTRCFRVLSTLLPGEAYLDLHTTFLGLWCSHDMNSAPGMEFECFYHAVIDKFRIDVEPSYDTVKFTKAHGPWNALFLSKSHARLADDVSLMNFELPPRTTNNAPLLPTPQDKRPPHELLSQLLFGLHFLGEDLRFMTHRHQDLLRLVPLICRIARIIRPEWADYWKRLAPSACPGWPSYPADLEHIDDRLPALPPDMLAGLYARISTTEHNLAVDDLRIGPKYNQIPGYALGRVDAYPNIHELNGYYAPLGNPNIKESRRRAEAAVLHMVKGHRGLDYLSLLSVGVAAPLREAARTCQLGPPAVWPINAYELVGRNDLTEGALVNGDLIFDDGYRSVKEHINGRIRRKTFSEIFDEAHKAVHGHGETVTGVELDITDFTEIRFGQDKRFQEVARMLRSSDIPSIKMIDRPELNEHDLAKEQQNQVLRTAERTLSLPLGRAMFTFGSVPVVTKEAYALPKIELSVRLQPHNTVIAPETTKIPPESLQWADFHNGVAAGLRLSPSSGTVDSSWIAFNKPETLTPEHAGFLFGLGLTGHLKEMLTWHTFSYLTPKHDLTSIGVLLGLSAANVGSSNRHVTKLLAVHTPALLPTQAVDLNVPLLTQAAGLIGIGLLYMGTKNRRMAEVAINQISRKDLFQPDLSNEHRESYTVAAALSFGMIMLGRGTVASSPADIALLSRLRVLIHGEGPSALYGKPPKPSFDVNLTSPAASIALGLMYLKTERQDVADILTIPDTVLALNQMQPSFLLIRTLARSLIMWDAIKPDKDWISAQIPEAIAKAVQARMRGQVIDEALELAYYHILSGCCLSIALKHAGTAREEAYIMLIGYYDLFSRFAHTGSAAFSHKIKRSAIRDGLNVVSLSLNMVMAGTGEINCLRRLRYAHGMYNAPIRYGSHMATHMSLGLLFLGGGRFTLGTSNAAIACLVTAFYPRFPAMSSDNKGHLQALRHLWVLAVEPRCLIARDVDTKELVYLPMKIRVKEGAATGGTQLISPSLLPGLDRLLSIKVDTPRYWPLFLDIANVPHHREALLRSQTLYVKRRTAFLSYLEDPKGSRSLFVRSGNSTGDAATLDFPQVTGTRAHPAGDLQHFITSFSNDRFFLGFADKLCREDGETAEERTFNSFCHAALLDSIIQDKPETLQTHLLLYRTRRIHIASRYCFLELQNLRFAADFYTKVYGRRFSGLDDLPNLSGLYRPPLLRESSVLAVLHQHDAMLASIWQAEDGLLRMALKKYALGQDISGKIELALAWYLLRHNVPAASFLGLLRELARDAHAQCATLPPPEGTRGTDAAAGALLDEGIKLVMHATGTTMVPQYGSGWSVQSVEDILEAWRIA